MTTIRLPYQFEPRPYQVPILRAMDGGARRAVAVWHRRAGKEKTFLNYMAKKTIERVGAYWYIFPTYSQGKKAIWNGRDKAGFPFMGHFPDEYVVARDATDMTLQLASGSMFQIVGSDKIDSLMSTNPIGCVFAEYSLQNPKAWEFIRPILRENGGWAVFDFTPRGRNHAYKIYELARKLMAEGNKDWYAERLTIEDTGVFSKADIDMERAEGMSEELIAQEYFCSFSGVQEGSIFARDLEACEEDGRVDKYPYQSHVGVETWWTFDESGAIAIWFTQTIGRNVFVFDYLENAGEALPWYARELQAKGYVYAAHYTLPKTQVSMTERSRMDSALSLGLQFKFAPTMPVDDGIEAGRGFFDRCYFDREKTETGRQALMSYHRDWDDKKRVFSTKPVHDWAAFAADAWRCLATAHRDAGRARRRTYENGRDRPQVSEGTTAWLAG